MKPSSLIILAALGVGGYLAYKYWPTLVGTVQPDPTVSTIAGSTYMGSEDVPGPLYNAQGGTNSMPGSYNPLSSSPGANSALNGALEASGSGMNLGSVDA